MSGFQITITDAGRAALINAQNTGTVAFVLSEIGVSAQAIAGDLSGLTALPNERKRLATMAGDVVADDTLHVTIRDESADAYALRSFGLYASTGVLFAVYSQADPILEKSAAAMLLLAVDARLVALGTANVEFGPAGFTLPPASETIAGVVEIATDAEVDAGQDPWRVITARTLKRALGALSNFALKDHKHDAADVETGTFHANRIPELPMSRIAGLVATLADKASALHSHTIAQVSGLTAAIADIWNAINSKANADGANLTGIARVAAFFLGAGRAYLYPAGDGINIRVGPLGAEHYWSFTSQGNVLLNGGPMWHQGNFNPDSRVSVAATNLGATWNVPLTKISSAAHFSALPTGFSSMVTPDSIGTPGGYGYLYKMARRDSDHGWTGLWINHADGRADAHELFLGSALGGSELPGWTRVWTSANFNPATKATLGEAARFAAVHLGAGRGHIYGDGDRLVARVGPEGAERNFGFNTDGNFHAYNGIIISQHGRVWDPGNFNPADKAPALHSHDWAQVTGKPSLATTDGTGVFFGAWNFGVAVRVNGSDWRYLPNDARVEDIINWRAANNAETLAGALTHKFVSPAALWSFARSIGPNGYQQIPGTDLIIQWGVSNGSHPEGAVHAALPVAFGGGCLFACATPRNAGQAYGMDFVMQIVGRYLDRIVFYANRANSSSGNMSGYEWMAVGLARGNPDPVYSTGYPPGGGGGGGEDPFFRPEV